MTASEIGLKIPHYSKIEKALVKHTLIPCNTLAYYGIAVDNIVHYKKDIPKVVSIEDKTAFPIVAPNPSVQ